MARLMMISKDLLGGAAVSQILHPRTGTGVGRFRVKQIIAWNMNGINNTFQFSTIAPNYGAFELYDSVGTPDVDPNTSNELVMRVPVSSKSRINLTLPEAGMTFEKGIWMKVGTESNDNDDNSIYLQLVGYELR